MSFRGKNKSGTVYSGIFSRVLKDNSDGRLYGRRGIFFGTVGETAVTTMLTGVFYSTLLILLLRGADQLTETRYLTLIGTVQMFSGLAQVLSPFIFESMHRRKTLILILRGIYYFIQLIMLPFVTMLDSDVNVKAWIFMALVVIAAAAEAIGTPARSAWQLHSLPSETRNDYFGCVKIVTLILNAIISFAFGVFLDYFTENGNALAGVLIMRGIAIPIAAFVIKMYSRAEEPEYNEGIEKPTFKDIIKTPLRSKIFMVMVLIQVLYSAGNSFHGSFYGVYLLNGAGISYTYLSICQIAAIPCVLLSMPLWSRCIRRFGWMPTLSVSMALYSLCYVINVFVTKETQYMYIISNVYCQLISGGMAIAISNLAFLYVPDKMRAACIAFFSAASSLAGVTATFVGGKFIEATNGKTIELLGLVIENRAYICFINFGIIMIGVAVSAAVAIYEKKHDKIKKL